TGLKLTCQTTLLRLLLLSSMKPLLLLVNYFADSLMDTMDETSLNPGLGLLRTSLCYLRTGITMHIAFFPICFGYTIAPSHQIYKVCLCCLSPSTIRSPLMESRQGRDGTSLHVGATPSSKDHLSLSPALSNLIGTAHVMEIKSHTYYEYVTFESFTCWQILPSEGIEDSMGSSNLDDYLDNQPQKLKRIVQDPSIVTPSKHVEERKKPRLEISQPLTLTHFKNHNLSPTQLVGEVISAMMNDIDELNEDECFDP
nr:hypothetical protein [Tanacetum cinerariifolium]